MLYITYEAKETQINVLKTQIITFSQPDSWRWSLADRGFYKDRETEFRKWSIEEPNNKNSEEHCTQMYDNGHWNDENCENPFAAVCFDVRGVNFNY